MASPLQCGDWVVHNRRGPGTVHRIIAGGRQLLVRFDGEEVLSSVARKEVVKLGGDGRPVPLEPLPAEAVQVVRRPVDPLVKAGSAEIAWILVEAMRCGVVPSGSVNLYTIGRERETQIVEQDLDDCQTGGAVRVFLGDYGSGKTHMLECVQEQALERGFIVAKAVLDGAEGSPAQPRRVYRALVRNLVYPDVKPHNQIGLRHLLHVAAKTVDGAWTTPRGEFYHAYLTPAINHYKALLASPDQIRAGELTEQLLDWLEGHPTISNIELNSILHSFTGLRSNRLYALQDHRTLAHLFAYLLGGLSCLAKACGYAGLVILLDEAELYGVLSSQARDFANLLFGYYCAAALGAEQVGFDVAKALRGGHAVHRRFPPVFHYPQGLYCAFAMTEDPQGLRCLQAIVDDSHFSELTPLTVGDYQETCKRVMSLYCQAYPEFTHGRDVEEPMGILVHQAIKRGKLPTPRQVLKLVVELLDYARLCNKGIADYVREMKERIES